MVISFRVVKVSVGLVFDVGVVEGFGIFFSVFIREFGGIIYLFLKELRGIVRSDGSIFLF